MIELAPRSVSPIARFGGQPIAIAAAALFIVVLGVGSITLWRAYTGSAPESDRAVATRQLQARAAQADSQGKAPLEQDGEPQPRQGARLIERRHEARSAG